MPTYEEYLRATATVLAESQQEIAHYNTWVLGYNFIVLPGVFSPKYYNDTELFAQELPINPGEKVLEIGPGTGAISIIAAHKGAGRVVVIDRNPQAVRNTQLNIERHHLEDRVEVREGNLYEPVLVGEKFDVIFWNTPFGLVPEDVELTDLERAVFDPGYEANKRFIQEAYQHLKPGGRIYLGTSSTLGRLDLLEKFAAEAGYELELIFEEDSTEILPVKFEIFQLVRH